MAPQLIEIDEAWKLVQGALGVNESEVLGLDQVAGRSLVPAAVSDMDSPPFDKSLVDGFAISAWLGSGGTYRVVETVTAGNTPQVEISGDQATRIMTGCPIPAGATGVVMVEETTEIDKIK